MFRSKKPGTWCKYHQSKINGTNYTEKPGLPKVVRDAILPIFMDLSKDELLKKNVYMVRHKTTTNQ